MRKSIYYSLSIIICLVLINGCNKKPNSYEKYKLSLESKIEFRSFKFRIGAKEYDELKTNILVIPIDRELVSYIVEYKTERDNLNPTESKNLKDKVFKKFINGDDAFFAIFCINKGIVENRIFFENFRENVYLSDDRNNDFKIKSFTPFLEHDLTLNSIDKGLLRFDNFRKYGGNTYSLFLNNLKIYSGYYDKTASYNYILSFDSDDFAVTQLLSDGLNLEEIKQQLKIEKQVEFGLFDLIELMRDIITVVEVAVLIAA